MTDDADRREVPMRDMQTYIDRDDEMLQAGVLADGSGVRFITGPTGCVVTLDDLPMIVARLQEFADIATALRAARPEGSST